jgi:hypothetical protein
VTFPEIGSPSLSLGRAQAPTSTSELPVTVDKSIILFLSQIIFEFIVFGTLNCHLLYRRGVRVSADPFQDILSLISSTAGVCSYFTLSVGLVRFNLGSLPALHQGYKLRFCSLTFVANFLSNRT